MDELKSGSLEGKSWIAQLEEKEKARTGIGSLKVRYTSVFGYYIEVSKANLDKVPTDYHRKQTLVNAERFITPELKEMEGKVLGAQEKADRLEYEIFEEIRGQVAKELSRLQRTARIHRRTGCLRRHGLGGRPGPPCSAPKWTTPGN